MTKTKLGVLKIALAAVLVLTLVASLCLSVAFAEGTDPQTRDYNEVYDRMLDGVVGNSEATPAYRSVSWAAGQCNTVTDPIYKIGSEKLGGAESVSIELRSPDRSVTLNDVKMGLRLSDDDAVATQNSYVLGSDDVIDGVSINGNEIGTEWAVLTITFAQTEIQVDGSPLNTDGLLGLHFYVANNEAGKLAIRKVSVTKLGSTIVLQDFAGNSDKWWDGGAEGTFVDVATCYEIATSKAITSDVATSNNTDGAYDAIVLAISGSGTVTVAPVLADGSVGAAKAWEELTDLASTPVAALDGNHRNAVIGLDSLGAKQIKGVEISVTGGSVRVSSIFFTNLETVTPDKYFPVLDSESIAYLSQFNFEYLTAGADYDKAVQDSAAFNCDYVLSYSTKNNVITNGHLVLAAQGEAFTSIKIRSKVASEGRRYLVIKYALENGATLNDFRFDVIKTEGDAGVGIKYANQCLAGVALPSLSAANPYTAEGNYNYLVVDLALTFGETEISGVDMYISGAGEVLIDEIFYANACEYKLNEETKHTFDAFDSIPAASGEGALYWWTDISNASILSIEDGALKIDVAAGTAVCIGGAKPGNNKDWNSRYMVWRMKADNFDMSTFRIAWFDGTTSFANQGAFKTINGAEFILTDEYAEMIIDLDASEISREIEGFRLWLGGWNAEAGSLYIDEIYFADALIQSENAYSASTTLTANDNGYNYICGGDFANTTVAPFVELSFTALNTFKYDTIRVEFQGTDHVEVPASVLNLADPVVLGGGEEAEMRTQTVLLNLAAVGITNYADITAVHAHMNAVNVDSEVTFGVRYIDYVPSVKSVALPTNDDSAPAIESAIATTGKVGTEITLSATATDNYDNAVTIAYEVTIGSETVAVSNDKFTPAKAGTYAVKIVATDAAGNTATKVVEIVVASNGNPDLNPNPDPQPGPGSDPQPEGLGAGAIIAIVVASVAVAAGAIVAVVLIRKKKNVK